MRTISTRERMTRLAIRHRLTDAARTDALPDLCDAVVGLHASDPASVYLSATARMRAPATGAVESALFDAHSILRLHAMRRTLWVFTPPVARAAHASCTVALAKTEWSLCAKLVEESGVAPDGPKWVEAARRETLAALRSVGSAGSRELGKLVPALTAKLQLSVGKPYAGTQSAHTRVLQNLGFDAEIVRGRQRGTWANGEYSWALMHDWVPGGVAGADADEASCELVGRYLRSFGPATTADIAWWTGWSASRAKKALSSLGAVGVTLDDTSDAWVLSDDVDAPDGDADPWVALLPSLDPTTMGWKERDWYLGKATTLGGPLFDRNGNCGPTVWVDGRVVGGWAQRKDGSIALAYLETVPAKRRKQVDDAAERLRSVIGDVRVSPRFPVPMQKELLA